MKNTGFHIDYLPEDLSVQYVFPKSFDYQDLVSQPPQELDQAWVKYNENMIRLIDMASNHEPYYIRAEEPDIWMNYFNLLGRNSNGLNEQDPMRGAAAKALQKHKGGTKPPQRGVDFAVILPYGDS